VQHSDLNNLNNYTASTVESKVKNERICGRSGELGRLLSVSFALSVLLKVFIEAKNIAKGLKAQVDL
jgi:hypothetical protein